MKISKHLAEHAISELLQMGYTVDGDRLNPPEKLSDFACKFFGVRAPADSVTAPAGGANWAQLRSALAMLMLGWGRNPNQTMDACYRVLDSATEPGTALAILRTAPDWRSFMAADRAKADSVLEDADPLQGAANWLAEAHGQFCVAVLQGCLMIGYNRAKRLHDAALAARKQGGAT